MKRVIIFQPTLTTYRIDFFNRIAQALGERFCLYYSPTALGILTEHGTTLPWARQLGSMLRLLPGAEWQSGVLSVPIYDGDIIVVSGSPRNLSGMLLLLKAKLVGARTIWWGHFWSSTSRTHRFILRLALMKLADAVLFYTDHEVEEYRSGSGRGDKRPIGALNNGINVDPIIQLRAPYVATSRPAELLFIGRLTEKAELQTLIRALAEPELLHIRLHVVGDGALRGALESLSQDLGIGDRIVWHGGTTSEPEIAKIANRCRAFVYPGGVGLSLIHAMAYGLPSIVHDDRWRHMPEIAAFIDGKTGRAFKRGSVSSLTSVLSELVQNPATLDSMSSAATTQADTRFNSTEMCRRFSSFLSLVNARKQ